MNHRSLVVIAAHPDDETLGFGGTIAHYTSEGVDVVNFNTTRSDGDALPGIVARVRRAAQKGRS
jgi:LmbE family N-acetylglucosaminyl deacetylase